MASSQSTSVTSNDGSSGGEDLTDALTPRQIECLTWVQEGKTAWETGQIMGISQRTVESYLAIAYGKLRVRTRVQAVIRARALGLL